MATNSLKIESIKELQRKLSSLFGVSGYEEEVRAFILGIVEDKRLADKVWTDPLGNVLAIKEGITGKNRILLDAHIDEIGFMVSHITEKGFLRFVPVGTWDVRILLGQPVILKSGNGKIYNGIIGSKPPHLSTIEERKKLVDIDKMYIDIGMRSKEEVLENHIDIGAVGTLDSPYIEFPNGMVRGKAFDDRTGCNVLIHILMLLKTTNHSDTVLFNFAAQEETGGQGAQTGAYTLKPSMAIAIENTTAGDVPGITADKIPVYIGKGPAITVADISILSNPKVNARLIKNAEYENIPWQYKKPKYGKTDAGMIQVTRGGVPSTVVSVPCRYIHSPTSLLKLEDIYHTIRLIEAFIYNPANI
ncbi:MAG: M42 family metallopeptidase [Promethearchaeota archaeon]